MIRRTATFALTSVVLMLAFAGTATAQVSPPTSAVLPSTTLGSGVSSGDLARTGTDIMPSVMIALALTAVGVFFVVVARRRLHTHAAA